MAYPSAVPVVDHVPSAGDTEAFETDESAPTPRSPQTRAQLGHRASMIRMRDDIPEEDMPPRRRFVLTAPPPGCDIAESFVAATARPPKGYVRALQASEHRMMTFIEEVNLRVSYQAQVRRQESEDFYKQLHDARTDRKDIRLEIDVVRGQRTTYEIELHERAEDDVVRQMMRTHVLKASAHIDKVEDNDNSC
ncbi:hypothetical protein Tco_0573866 [Tanacetum coccineum]